ncbi:hypothetical protein JXA56_05340 [Candidatus Micrarchaeota archaeon]|nr:hypothetical protein [Candidatus Micrarchaeota archaeon]
MADFEEKAKTIPEYEEFISKMHYEDIDRLEFSKKMATEISLLQKNIYTTMEWPVKLVHPMFEARAPYAVPNNYFQNIFLDDERLGNSFAHGAMRSVFFIKDTMVLFSKSVNFRDGREFFTSFILAHFSKGEYKINKIMSDINVKVNMEKAMKNLITGNVEKKRIAFNFIHQPVEGRMVSREQVVNSARFRQAYERFGGAQLKSASVDMEGYAITVPHFSPHPYMLRLYSKFGFEDNKAMQLAVPDYFRDR